VPQLSRRLADAEVWLQKAAASAPDDFRVQERLGLLYRLTSRKGEAQKAFARAAASHQRDLIGNQEALDCMQALQSQGHQV
jgi:Flp pilus assembly protein TadD